jgi:SAM-dependent methyltransferase
MEQVEQGHYAQKQLGCRSSIIRWSHTARFRLAMLLAGDHQAGRLLDYGCGDGTFMGLVADRFAVCIGADVDEVQIDDCQSRFAPLPNLHFCLVRDLSDARHARAYDVVTCMETLEHCLEPIVDRVLDDLQRLCAPDGRIVISVPIEIGPVFFIKFIVRKLAALRGLSDYARYETYSLGDAWRMAFATKDTIVARPAYGPAGAPYHSHYGFNWRRLRIKVADAFELKRTLFSPAGWCGGWLSSQVWFVCQPKQKVGT